jgi:hypothetical protein
MPDVHRRTTGSRQVGVKRVLGVVAVVALAMVAACSSGSDVDVTDRTPLDADTTQDGPDTTDAPPDISTPDTVGPDVTIEVPSRPSDSAPTGPSETVSPDPSTGEDGTGAGPVDPADVDLIVELWAGYDEAVKEGVDAKVAYIASHSYPGLELTEELCAEDPSVEGYVPVVGADLDAESIAPEPDWVIRIAGSPVDGETPDGTIYVHDVTISYDDGTAETGPAHTTILDGTAYFFFDCSA